MSTQNSNTMKETNNDKITILKIENNVQTTYNEKFGLIVLKSGNQKLTEVIISFLVLSKKKVPYRF